MNYHFKLKSGNEKTGPIPVTTSSKETCWKGCPFYSNCYASGGPLAIHWKLVTKGARGGTFASLLDNIRALPANQRFRHNQAGDLPGAGGRINPAEMRALIEAARGKRGFTYTHKPLTAPNVALIRESNAAGFSVNASANSLRHADDILDSHPDIPVCAVVPMDAPRRMTTPSGRRVVSCPATAEGSTVTCATCGLCAFARRDYVIAFHAHGQSRRAVSAIASN
jgi:hypothetical protein